MDEYIKREDALKALQSVRDCLADSILKHRHIPDCQKEVFEAIISAAERVINRIPHEDVVEVTRCKDCKHWCIQEGNDVNQSYFCSRDKMWCMPTRKADDFCSYGERKE